MKSVSFSRPTEAEVRLKVPRREALLNRHLASATRGVATRPARRLTSGWLSSRAVCLGLVLLGAGFCAEAAPNKNVKADPATNAPAAAVEIEIPQSVFMIPASAREGRNPFFPRSAVVQSIQKAAAPVLDTSSIVLNGITSRPRPSVMINGITFEKGEEHELKTPNGAKVRVRCQDIRPDSAIVVVNGLEQRELRLRSGL